MCPTELTAFSDRAKEFEALGAQVIALSTDTPEVHLAWIRTPRRRGGLGPMQIPLVADVTKNIANQVDKSCGSGADSWEYDDKEPFGAMGKESMLGVVL